VDGAVDGDEHGELVEDRRDEDARGTAPMKRIQFWCFANRPARRGLAETASTTTSATTVAAAIPRAIQELSSSRSDGSRRKPTIVSSGSATKPLRRSMTTDAKATSPVPVDFVARLTRRTSPPMVDGSTLPTNWPAR
jgi:Tfp pilus assembly protein PilV